MTSRRRDLLAAAVLALLFESGCFSWLAIQHPPSPPIDPREPLKCTRNVAAPVVDTVVALGLGGGAVAVWRGYASEVKFIAALAVDILAIPAALSAGSAYLGFESMARCRELDEAVNQCLKGDSVACGKLGSGEGPPQGPSPAPAHSP